MSLAIAMECSWDETMLLKPKQDHIPTFISQKHTIMHKSKKNHIARNKQTSRLFQLLLTKGKKKHMNDQNKNKKRHKTRTDGVVKNDHKTSSYNW